MPNKQPNSNAKLRRGLYRLNSANTGIVMPKSIRATNMVALDHYIKQLRKVGNKPNQPNVAYQSNKPKQSNGFATSPTSPASSKSATTCATPSNCIGCTSSACAKSEPASPYFKSISATGRKFAPTDAIKYRAKPTKQSTTQRKNKCGRSWDSVITRFNSQTKLSSAQYVSNNGHGAANTKRNLSERPNNDGTINNNTFISNSI